MRRSIASLILLAASGNALAADTYPSYPLRMIHGFARGGNVEITARLLATQFTDHLQR